MSPNEYFCHLLLDTINDQWDTHKLEFQADSFSLSVRHHTFVVALSDAFLKVGVIIGVDVSEHNGRIFYLYQSLQTKR